MTDLQYHLVQASSFLIGAIIGYFLLRRWEEYQIAQEAQMFLGDAEVHRNAGH